MTPAHTYTYVEISHGKLRSKCACKKTGSPKTMYHICLDYSFYSFRHSQLRPTTKDSQFYGDLLTLPSVERSWLSLWHVLEVSVFLGYTALFGVWPPQPYIWLGKSRELPQGSPVSKSPKFLVPPGAQYSSGTSQEKSRRMKSGENGGRHSEAHGEITPLLTAQRPGQVIAGCSCVSR